MCEANPIQGIMYKVVDNDQYDLCQQCEALNFEKDRMVIKIRTQDQYKQLEQFFKEEEDPDKDKEAEVKEADKKDIENFK